MLIVDAQVHIWSGGTPNPPHRKLPAYTKDDLLHDMEEAGVRAAVLHPPSWDDKDNRLALAAAQQHPDRLAVLGCFDVSREENRELVDTWTKQPGMLGLRFSFLRPGEENWLVDGTMDWLWPAAERAGLPVGLLLAPGRIQAIPAIAERHPGVHLLIDHMARARGSKDDASFADLGELLALARYPNVAVKATGVPAYSSEVYPYRNIHRYLKQMFEAFGPERMFWGTDITRMPCSWHQCITLFTEELPWLKGRDLELVMGRGLCNWIGWKLQ